MIMYRNVALGMVAKGEAKIEGTCSPDGELGQHYAIVTNYRDQRSDHFALRDGEVYDNETNTLIGADGSAIETKAAATLGRSGIKTGNHPDEPVKSGRNAEKSASV